MLRLSVFAGVGGAAGADWGQDGDRPRAAGGVSPSAGEVSAGARGSEQADAGGTGEGRGEKGGSQTGTEISGEATGWRRRDWRGKGRQTRLANGNWNIRWDNRLMQEGLEREGEANEARKLELKSQVRQQADAEGTGEGRGEKGGSQTGTEISGETTGWRRRDWRGKGRERRLANWNWNIRWDNRLTQEGLEREEERKEARKLELETRVRQLADAGGTGEGRGDKGGAQTGTGISGETTGWRRRDWEGVRGKRRERRLANWNWRLGWDNWLTQEGLEREGEAKEARKLELEARVSYRVNAAVRGPLHTALR